MKMRRLLYNQSFGLRTLSQSFINMLSIIILTKHASGFASNSNMGIRTFVSIIFIAFRIHKKKAKESERKPSFNVTFNVVEQCTNQIPHQLELRAVDPSFLSADLEIDGQLFSSCRGQQQFPLIR